MSPRIVGKLVAALALTGGIAAAQPQVAPSQAAPPQEVAPKAVEAPPAAAPTTTPKPGIASDSAKETPVQATPAAPKPPPAPERRTRYQIAVLEALDKVTAESLRFEAPVGQPIRYRTLIFTVKACEHTAPDEPVEDSIAYVTVDSQPRAQPGKAVLAPRQVFKGWMYASSPSLNPLQHPVYAAWLITCRAAAPVNPPAGAAPEPAVPKPAPPPAARPVAAPLSSTPKPAPLPEVVATPTAPPKP